MPPLLTTTLAAVTVVGSMASPNNTVTACVRQTLMLVSSGLTLVTVGAVASAPAPVVKLQV